VALVDVYVLRRGAAGLEALVLRRAPGSRSPGSWEGVHGHVEPGESPADAARREVGEETGLAPERLYNLSRVEAFYLHRADVIAVVPCFVAFAAPGELRLSTEHDQAEWLPLDDAGARCSWPRGRRALEDIGVVFAAGDAGPLEDVLRIR
jgi:dihydroneopterin triphosphate diphosphatase